MSSVNAYLRENIASISSGSIYVAPQIEDKKLNNAIKSFAYEGKHSSVVALLDTTLFNSGKEGLLFTGEQVIYRPAFSSPIPIAYAEIKSVEYREETVGSKADKIKKTICVVKDDNSQVVIEYLGECDYKILAELLSTVAKDFDEYQDESQLITISEMSEALKIAYLKIIINMAYADDEIIDDKEFAEILLLMTRLDLSPDSRFTVRSYMASMDSLIPLEALISEIDSQSPEVRLKHFISHW